MNPYFEDGNIRLFNCDVLEGLRAMDSESVQCCVTSPPYWGLRDYGIEGQIGLEKTPEEYIEKMVRVFREVHRVLKNDGTIWINIGDSYYGSWGNSGAREGNQREKRRPRLERNGQSTDRPASSKKHNSIKPKDLIGIPWMLAFALRADGWYLRQDIIWSKPNPMPESVTDRCTKSHEYIFLLSKSQRYYYDSDAIRENPKPSTIARLSQDINNQTGSLRANGGTRPDRPMKTVFKGRGGLSKPDYDKRKWIDRHDGISRPPMTMKNRQYNPLGANKKSVWTLPTARFPDAHFATFPPQLIAPCILAGSREGDTVLDTFFGSGVTGEVARDHGRKCDGIEIHPDYCELSIKRFKQGVFVYDQ